MFLLELTPKTVIKHLDGESTSSTSYRGPIGSLLPTVEELDINDNFEVMVVADHLKMVPPDNEEDQSTDAMHLVLLVIAVTTGEIPDLLRDITLGPLILSRWMTTCNRCLLLWISKHDHLLDEEARANLKVFIILALFYPCRSESSN